MKQKYIYAVLEMEPKTVDLMGMFFRILDCAGE